MACAASSMGAVAAGMSSGMELDAGRTWPFCIVAVAVTSYDCPAARLLGPSSAQDMVAQVAVRQPALGWAVPLGQAVTE